ncbi:cysteine-rich, acidic integral membrane protein-like [Wyeomyia smithii]|uniref:cysteine-rich, acidic integral membrane protein-like n=1 Tax=Wyeomyia smithii TaxID=174621 RepID=UPI002467D784|nr:cysteine-rich, acidic integral membrane protein-like [Wyeomyia smithii]
MMASQSECIICLEQISDSSADETRQLLCFHRFHTQCITRWLAVSNKCPVCRLAASETFTGNIPEGDAAWDISDDEYDSEYDDFFISILNGAESDLTDDEILEVSENHIETDTSDEYGNSNSDVNEADDDNLISDAREADEDNLISDVSEADDADSFAEDFDIEEQDDQDIDVDSEVEIDDDLAFQYHYDENEECEMPDYLECQDEDWCW